MLRVMNIFGLIHSWKLKVWYEIWHFIASFFYFAQTDMVMVSDVLNYIEKPCMSSCSQAEFLDHYADDFEEERVHKLGPG